MLIDSHAHLDAPYFRDRLPAVLDRAKKAGVERIITIGVTPSSSRNGIKIAEKYPLVFAAAGYHPHWADGSDSDRLAQAERLAGKPSVVALGEIGLDYHHFHASKQNQIKLFRH
ncbi:MAG TPA: TatD family hydrolase, partial [Desulfobacterales bacterium]|nr:TatD family hydrolase [Desulfobacterales bacterium]